jgi:hypothetical protein
MLANKIQWMTVDDEDVEKKARVSGDSTDTIQLQQQDIKVFSVKYTPQTQILQ